MGLTYKNGDLIWGKMKGYRPWPGLITTPPAYMRPPRNVSAYHCIYFFGTNDYAWVKKCHIMPYREFKNRMTKNCSNTSATAFNNAVLQIEEYIKNQEFGNIDSNYSVNKNKEKFINATKKIHTNYSSTYVHNNDIVKLANDHGNATKATKYLGHKNPETLEQFYISDDSEQSFKTTIENEHQKHDRGQFFESKKMFMNATKKIYSNNKLHIDIVKSAEGRGNTTIGTKYLGNKITEALEQFYISDDSEEHVINTIENERLESDSKKPTFKKKLCSSNKDQTRSHGNSEIEDELVIKKLPPNNEIYSLTKSAHNFDLNQTQCDEITQSNDITENNFMTVNLEIDSDSIGGDSYWREETLERNKEIETLPKMYKQPNITDIMDLDKRSVQNDYGGNNKIMSQLAAIALVKLERIDIFSCKDCAKGFLDEPRLELHRLIHHQSTKSRIEKLAQSTLAKTNIVTKRIIGTKPNSSKESQHTNKPEINILRSDQEKSSCKQNAKLSLRPRKENYGQDISGRQYYKLQTKEQCKLLKNELNQYECPKCGVTTKRYEYAVSHFWGHIGVKPFICKICNKGFPCADYVRRHLLTHNSIKKYKCKYCSKAFLRRQHLKRHLIAHDAIKKYKCKYCQKAYTVVGDLNRHLKTHGTGNYKCEHCQKAYFYATQLKRHFLIHRGTKNYKHCPKVFVTNDELRKQLHTHFQKPSSIVFYECKRCQRKFLYQSSLLEHNKSECSYEP